MSAVSLYLDVSVLDHLFRSFTFQKPATLAFCLLLSPASSTDTGDLTGKEIANANGYARAMLTPDDANWTPPDLNGLIHNRVIINFPTALANWGTVVGLAVTDSGTYGQGNLLFQGMLRTPMVVNKGVKFKFNVADVAIGLR